ncbi:unnamed protein product [Paramecium sonneborni]|uniref:Major facilitator superfamily (MFS) profile domain-containing protein n=1 Tax=Paramecium sonneborni TaxID=65129 RepID=A0A8S1JVX2_9CILI|nr:unnamed protein product [Paramecium sonneborni]
MGKKTVLILTFVSYAQMHAARTLWSYMQKYLTIENYDKNKMGQAYLTFLLTYGIGMNTVGPMCCKRSLKHSIGISCMAVGMLFAILGILQEFQLLTFPLVIVLMAINGLIQSACYPACVNVLGNWFKNHKVGLMMGLWSGCVNAGDIYGLIIGDVVIQRFEKPVYWGFYFMSGCLILASITTLSYLQSEPRNQIQGINESESAPLILKQKNKNLNILSAWLVPGVAIYAVGYACLKGTFYGFLDWLPFYFQQKGEKLENHSSYISQMFDVGCYVGGIFLGYLGDKYKRRACYFVPSLLLAMSSMLVIRFCLDLIVWPYYLCILAIGIFQGGPYNNISGVISIELTKQFENDKAAISTVSSLIESTGTLTAAMFQVIIPRIGDEHLFIFLCLITLLAELVCCVLLFRELKTKKRSK